MTITGFRRSFYTLVHNQPQNGNQDVYYNRDSPSALKGMGGFVGLVPAICQIEQAQRVSYYFSWYYDSAWR